MTILIISLIMLLLLTLPYLTPEIYDDGTLNNYSILLKYIDNYFSLYGGITDRFNATYYSFLTKSIDPNYPIVNITYNGIIIYEDFLLKDFPYRLDEINYFYDDSGITIIAYSTLYDNILNSVLNILRTIYIGFIIGWMIIKLDEDSKTYALYPLENIMNIIQAISRDPIGSRNINKINNDKKFDFSKASGSELEQLKILNKKEQKRLKSKSNYEVKTIEAAVIKISALLAIGFGEAGEEIIKYNLKPRTQEVNPMVKGRKKIAIFGFCDIREFQIVNECLQERTMSYVNQIANIVHTSVDKFRGAANKNIGDAFLCVWKFGKKNKLKNLTNDKNLILNNKNNNKNLEINLIKEELNQNEAADHALLGYLDIIMRINRKKNILIYNKDKDILNRIPGYKVKMGFGLHIGWAIEGAIGSIHKIDASYLSPNVNMSSRLQAATKQYGVNILISGDLHDLLSSELRKICRMIDIVTVKGSLKPIKLYTVDLNTNLTASLKDTPNINLSENRKIYEQKKVRFYKNVKEYGSIGNFVINKSSFKEMFFLDRQEDFNILYSKAMDYYITGDWDKARFYLRKCFEIDSRDGPSMTLFNYIGSYNYVSPVNWKGYRELISK